MFTIQFSDTFQKQYKRLPQTIRNKTKKKITLLKHDPYTDSLCTHKLTGKLNNYWACSIDYQYRLVFSIQDNKIIRLQSIGTHKIYDRLAR